MLIRFKNKMTMAIIQMINQGNQLGGLPSHIEISPEEATQIIDEIKSLREQKETQHQRYKFHNGIVDARFAFLARDLNNEEKLQLLADWTEGKLIVTFDNINLRVVLVEDKNREYHK